MLKLNNVLSVETYGDKSKVVNPKIPYKIYRCIKKYIEKKSLRIIAVLIFLIIVILFLHLCRNYFVNVNMPIGEEM